MADEIGAIDSVGGGSDIGSSSVGGADQSFQVASLPPNGGVDNAGNDSPAALPSDGFSPSGEAGDEGQKSDLAGSIGSWAKKSPDEQPAVDGGDKSAKAKTSDKADDPPTMRRGSGMHGKPDDHVRQLQERLRAAGIDPGPIDGKFGPRTEAAVRKFQKKAGLDQVDGIAGPKTFEALNNPKAQRPDDAKGADDPKGPRGRADDGRPISPDDKDYLKSRLAAGTNSNRIGNMNPAFARDAAGFLRDMEKNHGFHPRITSGWRPGHGSSNHYTGNAMDLTRSDRGRVSNGDLALMRRVAAQYGLKILDERDHGYNSNWSGSHLHLSRTGR
jgi:hypothetical protein